MGNLIVAVVAMIASMAITLISHPADGNVTKREED